MDESICYQCYHFSFQVEIEILQYENIHSTIINLKIRGKFEKQQETKNGL